MFKYLNRVVSTFLVIGVIIILSAILTGGFLLVRQYTKISKENKVISTPTSTSVPILPEVVTPNETSDIKTDSNAPLAECRHECGPAGSKYCINDSSYELCESYNNDKCTKYSIINCPVNNTTCREGLCIQKKECVLRPYQDQDIVPCGYPEYVCIDNVLIKGVYFIASDTDKAKIYNGWKGSMEKILYQNKIFFEREFRSKMKINYDIYPQIVVGGHKTSQYTNASIYILDDIKKYIEINNPDFLKENSSEYVSWVIYTPLPVLGAGCQMTSNPSFWLEPEYLGEAPLGETNPNGVNTGYIASAHELGHTLGMVHPWEMDININNDPNFGNEEKSVMGYNRDEHLSLMNYFIREDVKKNMGLK